MEILGQASISISIMWNSPSSLHKQTKCRCTCLSTLPCINNITSDCNHRAFIFGLGYVGHAMARFLQKKGWNVWGTCSTLSKREAMEEQGIRAFHFNVQKEGGEGLGQNGLEALYNCSHVISTIPPLPYLSNDPVLSLNMQQLVEAITNKSLSWIGYVSSTGVYGDWKGAWVDEECEPKPVDKKGVKRLYAEQEWLQLGKDSGACVHIFRLGGIYGPGRSAVDTLLSCNNLSLTQQAREGRHYTSRVHVVDICQVILSSMKSPSPGRVYNVVDNDPASRSEVFSFARSLIKEKWPGKLLNIETKFPSAFTAIAEVQGSEMLPGKRVRNKRIIDELKVNLLYPTYRSGLKSIIEEMD